ncbi:MAG TPA: hypothetical protein DCM27_02705, partial [Rhodospirillaceae bacterium]|nr:hypothetical protein [Rhodospirillaceae bacterium]
MSPNCRNIIAPFLRFTQKLTTKGTKNHEDLFFSVLPSVTSVLSVVKSYISPVIPANAGIQKIRMQAQKLTFWIAASLSLLAMTSGVAVAAINIPFTINLSENVTVTGTPRIAIDVGGNTRYATYTSGTGTNALIFTLSPTIGDVDLDGVTVSSPIDLNGGTIKDIAGNDATLTFTPPNTTGIKINYPSLGMDFTNGASGRYTLNGTAYNSLSSFLTASGGTFARNSVATYFDSTGTLQTVSNNTPRFDYDPVTHQSKGILIEESRTNLLNYSMTFNTSSWNLARSNIQLAATTSPDGTMNAVKLYNNGVAGGSYAGYFRNYQANQTYTYSVYAKKADMSYITMVIYATVGWIADGNVIFDLNAGTATMYGTGISAYHISALPNGWYRCSITATFGSTNTNTQYPVLLLNPQTDGVSGVYLWGAQLEQAPFATSYIPTTTAAVTRAADVMTIPTASWWNAGEGTLFANTSTLYSSATDNVTIRDVMRINDGTANNFHRLFQYRNKYGGSTNVGGSLVADVQTGTVVAGTTYGVGYSYMPNS